MGDYRTVGEVARLSGVTVRTLHHYDRTGLLKPSARSDAGYRLYSRSDLARLQQVLLYRRLGLGLADIGRIIGDPGFDRAAVLEEQRRLLQREAVRVRALIDAVEDAIAAEERGVLMDPQELFEVFGDFDPAAYQAEAAERWPRSGYDESRRRTARYGREQWQTITAEAREIGERFAAGLAGGMPSDHPEMLAAAESHRRHIDRWFYPCSRTVHRGLGDLYVQDPRFTAYWEGFAPGLAPYVRNAFAANAARADAQS